MSEYKNDIDELFYEGIEAHREHPANNVWKEIETELNKEAVTVYKKKYGKLKKGFTLLLLLFMGFLVYDIFGTYVFDETGTTVKQEITPVIENAGKSEHTLSDGDKQSSELPVKTSTQTSPVRETAPNNNIQHKSTTNTPGNNSQDIISPVAYKRKAIGKNKVPRIKDQSGSVIAKVNPLQEVVKGDITLSKKEVQPVAGEENGKVIVENAAANKEFALAPVKADATASNFAGNDDKQSDQQVAGDEDISLFTYQSTYISRLRNLSPGLFGPPLIITDAGKMNLLNGLRPSAENLVHPSSLYVPDPVVLKKSEHQKQNRFFLMPEYTSYTSFNIFTDNKPSRFNNSNSASTGAGSTGGSSQGQAMSGIRRNENLDFIRQSESVMMGHSFGLKAGYQMNSKLSIATGLNYTTFIADLDPRYIYARNDGTNVGFDLHTTLGSAFLFPQNFTSAVAGDSMWLSNTRNTARYIGIPLTIGYKLLSSKRFSLETFAGGQYDLLLRGNTWGVLDKGLATQSYVSAEITNLRPSYFSALVGLHGELWLGRNVSFVLSPTGRFALSNINQGGLVGTRTNFLGLSGGMRFRF
jgi:hypothetical protein